MRKRISKTTIALLVMFIMLFIIILIFNDFIFKIENELLSKAIILGLIATFLVTIRIFEESFNIDLRYPIYEGPIYDDFRVYFDIKRLDNIVKCSLHSLLQNSDHIESYEKVVRSLLLNYFRGKPVLVRYTGVRQGRFDAIKEEIERGRVDVLDILEDGSESDKIVEVLLKDIKEAFYIYGVLKGEDNPDRENIRCLCDFDVFMDIDTRLMSNEEILEKAREIGEPKFKVEYRMEERKFVTFLVDEQYVDGLKTYIREIVRENGFKGEIKTE